MNCSDEAEWHGGEYHAGCSEASKDGLAAFGDTSTHQTREMDTPHQSVSDLTGQIGMGHV